MPEGPRPIHPDFAKLRAYRHYFALREVGPYVHHFAVYFNCIEQSVDYFAVDDAGRVTREGGAWGGLAHPLREPKPVPDAMKAHAARAREALDDAYENESIRQVLYLGSYSKVVVEEMLPLEPPGDPTKRQATIRTVTLAADRELHVLESTPASFEGGTTLLCWSSIAHGDCSKPWWIDVGDIGKANAATPFLPALADDRSPESDAQRTAFAEAVLGAARAREAGQGGARLEDILAHQDDSLLPRDFAPPLSVVFTIHARPKLDPKTQQYITNQIDSRLRVDLPTADAVFGEARDEARTTLAGVQLEASATLAAVDPPPRDAVGERELTFRFTYELRDARGTKRRADVQAKGTVLLDRGSVALRALQMSVDPRIDVHTPPLAQKLPGVGAFGSLDAYVGLEVRPAEWFGPP